MTAPRFSPMLLREKALPQTYERGQAIAATDAISDLRLRGDWLEAEIQGNDWQPYRVRVHLPDLAEATCTCPYDWGGFCKHLVAVLIRYTKKPEAVEQQPAPAERVAALSADQKDALLTALINDHALADTIEHHLALLAVQPATPPQAAAPSPPPPLDVGPFRRQLRRELHSNFDHYSDYYGGGGANMEPYFAQIEARLRAGDGANALTLVITVLEELGEVVEEFGFLDEYLNIEALDALLAEAILATEPSGKSLRTLAAQLKQLGDHLEDYGMAEFELTAEALELGWDDPDLQAILDHGITEEPPEESELLTRLRLNVLEAQGRNEAFLRLSRATAQVDAYLTKLVALGRVDEAIAHAPRLIATQHDALVVAQALADAGVADDAIGVAEHGLSLPRPPQNDGQDGWPTPYVISSQSPLAQWLSDFAESRGDLERALRAGEMAFADHPSVTSFDRLQRLAGDGWSALRERLLLALPRASARYPQESVNIYLQEGMVEEAIGVVEKQYAGHELLRQVAEAAVTSHPQWVIDRATAQAMGIIEPGTAKYYDSAVRWLGLAREAWRADKRESEWTRFVAGIREAHGRKYKLMTLMKGL